MANTKKNVPDTINTKNTNTETLSDVKPQSEQAVADVKKDELITEIHEVATAFTDLTQTTSEPEKIQENPAPSAPPVVTNPVEEVIEAQQPSEPASVPAATEVVAGSTPPDTQAAPDKPAEAALSEPPTVKPQIQKSSVLAGLMGFLRNKMSLFKKSKTSSSEKTASATGSTEKRSFWKRYRWLVMIVIAFLILVGALIAAGLTIYAVGNEVINHGVKTSQLANETYQFIKTQDLVSAEAKLKETKESLVKTRDAYQKLTWLGNMPFIANYHEDGTAAFNAAVAGVEAGEILIAAITPYADVLGFQGQGSFMGGTVEDRIVKMVETLDKVTPELDKVSEKLNTVATEIGKINPEDYPEEVQGKAVRSKIIEAKTLVSDITLALTDARPIVEVLPQLLGHPEGKKYLVLFQNDGEIRPTGGFMSAFAVLHLDKGRVKAEKSDDIYALDRKFGNKTEAPEIIQKYLNEKVWHLRNMNLSPDFKTSMDIFKGYYDTLPGEFPIDGIIAIDTHVLEELIKVTGPIEVPGYGAFTTEPDKRCNLSQVVCELEHIIDKPLATLTTNRKSAILGPMMQVLMERSLGGGKEQLAKLMPLMFELMAEKHVLVYFEDEQAQKAAESFNIGGRIVETDKDYLHINNANFGGAKSDFYIQNAVEQEIEVAEDGTVQKKVSISYTHTEPMDNCNLEAGQLCLSGIQRNYFRVYVPQGSQLVEGLGSETEIKVGEDLGKTYYEGFFTLRPETKVKVMLVYTLPFKVAKGEKYQMLIQKQPGTQNHKYAVTVNGKLDEFELHKDLEKEW